MKYPTLPHGPKHWECKPIPTIKELTKMFAMGEDLSRNEIARIINKLNDLEKPNGLLTTHQKEQIDKTIHSKEKILYNKKVYGISGFFVKSNDQIKLIGHVEGLYASSRKLGYEPFTVHKNPSQTGREWLENRRS